jgi:hypothetical protein
MTEAELPPKDVLAPPREPWRHIVAFIAIAIILFLMSGVLFRALEAAF